MKLPGYWVPCAGKSVVNVPLSSTGMTTALSRPLLERVPMPNTSDPSAVGAPPAGTDGNSTITPLSSVANRATGFETCAAAATAVSTQPPGALELQAKSPGFAEPAVAHAGPQSCR